MAYIEREALYKFLTDQKDKETGAYSKGRNDGLDVARSALHNREITPAADVAPVVHGRWVGLEYDGYADGCPVYDLWECSECGEEVRGEDVPDTHPWCHGCGARMDGERKDGE